MHSIYNKVLFNIENNIDYNNIYFDINNLNNIYETNELNQTNDTNHTNKTINKNGYT